MVEAKAKELAILPFIKEKLDKNLI